MTPQRPPEAEAESEPPSPSTGVEASHSSHNSPSPLPRWGSRTFAGILANSLRGADHARPYASGNVYLSFGRTSDLCPSRRRRPSSPSAPFAIAIDIAIGADLYLSSLSLSLSFSFSLFMVRPQVSSSRNDKQASCELHHPSCHARDVRPCSSPCHQSLFSFSLFLIYFSSSCFCSLTDLILADLA